jgi:hypothetical protein
MPDLGWGMCAAYFCLAQFQAFADLAYPRLAGMQCYVMDGAPSFSAATDGGVNDIL